MIVHDESRVKEFLEMINELRTTHLEIGIFGEDDSEMLMIATTHEFGTTIKPKRGRFLTIPLNKKARDNNPRSFHDLFTLRADSGELYLVREKGKDELEFFYWLAKSVEIPERSFIRGGYDSNKDTIVNKAEPLLEKVLNLELPVEKFYEALGEEVVGLIREYLTDLKTPPNSPVTIKNKGSSNPLIDTGRLRQSITYKVVRE